MNLDQLLKWSRIYPPGHFQPSKWPRLSGYQYDDPTYDPPKYHISETLSGRLLDYYEDEIYFDYTPSELEPDAVWNVSVDLQP